MTKFSKGSEGGERNTSAMILNISSVWPWEILWCSQKGRTVQHSEYILAMPWLRKFVAL